MRIDFPSPSAGWLLVEPLVSMEEALAAVPESDRAAAENFVAPSRRREYLAWRALLYRELGPQRITYGPSGAPELEPGRGFIGVSHSREWVALCWSMERVVAVDIECGTRNFGPLQQHYMSPEECALSNHPAWPCIAWCAKECLYKLARRRGLELVRDLRLAAPHFEDAVSGWLAGSLPERQHRLRFRACADHWVVWSE